MRDLLMANEHGMIWKYQSECLEQPSLLRGLLQAYAQGEAVRSEIRALGEAIVTGLPVLWLGMGASYCSALAGSLTLSLHGRASLAAEASEWLHHFLSVQARFSGPVLVTTSGESAELVELCRRNGTKDNVLICNSSGSPCWSAARIRFPILAGPEYANATKTYTNATAACIILGSELAGIAWHSGAARAADVLEQALARIFARRGELDEFCKPATTIELIGRGAGMSGSIMGALCVREMTGVRAGAHSGGGFRHGPLLDVDSTHVAIIHALGPTAELGRRLAEDCLVRGGRVVLVQRKTMRPATNLLPIVLEEVPPPWEALTSILVPQALTLAMMERMGTQYVRVQTVSE